MTFFYVTAYLGVGFFLIIPQGTIVKISHTMCKFHTHIDKAVFEPHTQVHNLKSQASQASQACRMLQLICMLLHNIMRQLENSFMGCPHLSRTYNTCYFVFHVKL